MIKKIQQAAAHRRYKKRIMETADRLFPEAEDPHHPHYEAANEARCDWLKDQMIESQDEVGTWPVIMVVSMIAGASVMLYAWRH